MTTTIAPGLDSLTPTLVGGVFQFLTLVDPQFEAGDVTINGENITNLPTVNAAGDILLELTAAENVPGNVVQFRDQSTPQAWGDLDYHVVADASNTGLQPDQLYNLTIDNGTESNTATAIFATPPTE